MEKKKKTLHQNILMEWSVAPSIFNIKAQGLAHCLYWMKLSNCGVYEVYFNLLLEFDVIVVQKNNFVVVVFIFFNILYRSDTAASTNHYHQQSIPYCFPSLSSLFLLILLSYSMCYIVLSAVLFCRHCVLFLIVAFDRSSFVRVMFM